MRKILENYLAEIIVITLFVVMFSSCQTVKEIKGNTNNLNCTHVSR